MRRPGQRGNLPNKSVPVKKHPKYKFQNVGQSAGVYRDKVNADAAMAANSRPHESIERVPHGVDPFAGEENALQTRVEFRPNKAQMDAFNNIKKTKSVNIEAGINGYAKVTHEKVFLSKNSRPIAYKTNPIAEGHVQHERPVLEKKAKQISMTAGQNPDIDEEAYDLWQKSQVPSRKTQPQSSRSAVPSDYGVEAEYDSKYDPSLEQHRRHQSIQEQVQASISEAQASTMRPYIEQTSKSGQYRQGYIAEDAGYEYDYVESGDQWVQPQRVSRQASFYQQDAGYQDEQYVEAYDENITTYSLKDRRQIAEHDYNYDAGQHDKDEHYVEAYDDNVATYSIKDRRQIAEHQRHNDAHQQVHSSDVNVKSKAAETKQKKRVQFNLSESANQRSEQDYVIDSEFREQSKQNRRTQAKSTKGHANQDSHNVEMKVSNGASGNDVSLRAQDARKSRQSSARNMPNTNAQTAQDVDSLRLAEADTAVSAKQHRMKQSSNNDSMMKDREYAGVEVEIGPDTRDLNRYPNMKPVRKQADSGVKVASQVPQVDVKTRVEQALSRVRRQNAEVQSEQSNIGYDGLKTDTEERESLPISSKNRRQYSAKQESEVSAYAVVANNRSNDPNSTSNRRQYSAKGEEVAVANSEMDIATRMKEKSQRTRGVADHEYGKLSGMQNPYNEDSGIDPSILEAADHKKHLAREQGYDAKQISNYYEPGSSKTGLESNTRSRKPMINPVIDAKPIKNVEFKHNI